MFKWLLPFLFIATGASAQGVTPGSGGSYCPTLSIGSNGNVCASTAFVVNSLAAITGDISLSGSTATIAANAVTNAKLAPMAAGTIKGNNTGATGPALDLTAVQVTTMLNGIPNASGSSATTTGSISSGSSTLTLLSAIDFANGQGISINGAGTTFALGQPASVSMAVVGTPGSTSYAYTVVSLDSQGGSSAAVANVTTTTGNAVLTAQNKNNILWSAPGGTPPTGYAVYGRTAGSLTFLGITGSTAFVDVGQTPENKPDWLPSTPSGAAINQLLVTTVSSGGGSTTLTLGSPAINSVVGAYVTHDDTVALQAAITAAGASGKPVNIPSSSSYYQITVGLTLPNSAPVEISGAGRGSTYIFARTLGMYMFYKGTNFMRGGSLKNMTLEGNGLAFYNIYFAGGDNYSITDINAYDVIQGSNIHIGNGVSNAQEFFLTNIRIDNTNAGCFTWSCYPSNNVWIQGINNLLVNVLANGAVYANFLDDTMAAGNYYTNTHGYNYPVAISTNYNFVLAGYQSVVHGFEADGGNLADVSISGNANIFNGGSLQFDGLPPTIGINLVGTSTGNVIHSNNITNPTLANGVVNNSSGGTNSVCDNFVNGTYTGLATFSSNCN
jgi:hypothetical protein